MHVRATWGTISLETFGPGRFRDGDMRMIDVRVENHGSLFLFRPLTVRGEEWIWNNLPEKSPRLGAAAAVEHRYARDVAAGMIADGLELA